jgi:hypothetical protein
MAKTFYVSISPQNDWEITKPQVPVVQSCFSANPGLKFNPLYRFGYMSFCLFISGSNITTQHSNFTLVLPTLVQTVLGTFAHLLYFKILENKTSVDPDMNFGKLS